jgi:nicotinate-nucleotide adenylyltransferase
MIGVYGGTFDPIHFGHLRPALEVQQDLSLENVHFIPCGDPPHRNKPVADAQQRLAMVRAAIGDQPGFVVDERELHRSGPSYMVDTLLSLSEAFPDRTLCLMVGMDAFVDFDKWHQWQRIVELAHLVVTHRPGWDRDELNDNTTLASYVADCAVTEMQPLREQRAGLVYFIAVTQLDISSTKIRDAVRRREDIRYLVPDAVRAFIRQQHIYA